jgi:hypothetical protein
VRVFTGRNASGRPTQVAITVRGTKRDALREAAKLEAAPHRGAAGRTVGDVLHAWLEYKEASYTPASLRDQTGRIRQIEQDPIVKVAVARLVAYRRCAWRPTAAKPSPRNGPPWPRCGPAGSSAPSTPTLPTAGCVPP